MRTYTITIYDPRRPQGVVAVHEGLGKADADELASIYAALGYPPPTVVRSVSVSKCPQVSSGIGHETGERTAHNVA